MKFIFTFIILLISVDYITSTCSVQPIEVKLGDYCSRALKTYCEKGTFCSTSTGICNPILKPNQNCTYDDQCQPYSCLDNNGVKQCQQAKYAQVGEVCALDTDCITTTLKCVSGKCENQNQTCNTNYDCAFDQYCDMTQHKCQDALALGSTCTGLNQCPSGYVCAPIVDGPNSTTLTCQTPFKGQAGQRCSGLYTRQFVNDCDISKQLACNASKICEGPVKAEQAVCTSCSNSDLTQSCAVGGKCLCALTDTKGTGNGTCSENNFMTNTTVTAINTMYTCVRNQKCVFDFSYMTTILCFHIKCKAEVCKAMEYYEPYLLDSSFTGMALDSCDVKPVNEIAKCEVETTPPPTTEPPKTNDNSVSSSSLLFPSILISFLISFLISSFI